MREAECTFDYLSQMKVLSIIIVVVSVDFISNVMSFVYLVALFNPVVKFFVDRTDCVVKQLGVSSFFFSCFDIKRYSKKGIDEASCVICLVEFEENDEIIDLKCHESHKFHYPCIRSWLSKQFICPICRSHGIV